MRSAFLLGELGAKVQLAPDKGSPRGTSRPRGILVLTERWRVRYSGEGKSLQWGYRGMPFEGCPSMLLLPPGLLCSERRRVGDWEGDLRNFS